MKLFRAAACILMVFLVVPIVGCKGSVSKVFNIVKEELKQEAVEEGVKYAAGAVAGDSQGKSSSPATSGKSSVKSNLGKAGSVAAAGGAVAAAGQDDLGQNGEHGRRHQGGPGVPGQYHEQG